jgi:5-hydroxyisourate hydrolase-like protein (transthyretin family)
MTESRLGALARSWKAIFGLILAGGLFIFAWSVDSASASQRHGGRVAGVVISADTGTPVAGVDVWLDQVTDTYPTPRRRAKTDETGAFVFNRVHSGSYRLYAQKTGYLLADYLQQQSSDSQARLVVQEGTTISDVQVSLSLGGKVSGTVLNEQGNPADGLIVKLLALTPVGEDVSATSIVSTQTDAAGRYTLEGIYPGHYVLRAERRKLDQTSAQLEFAYYPDTESWQSAAPLDINSGDVLPDLNITFTPRTEPPVITGVIVDAQTKEPLAGVMVGLVDGSNLGLHTKTAADGRYRLEGMPSGHYMISAHGEGVGDGYEWVLKKVAVASGVNDLDFELSPSPLVIATVQYVGSGAPPAMGDYMVSVRVGNNTQGITYNGQPTFEFRGLKTGRARIGVGFSALQYKLSAIVVDDQDITGQTLELHSGDKLTGVRILISDDQTADAGIVNQSQIQP